jgi:hypothetical protein
MEPEFQRIIVRVVVIGLVIVTGGAGLLFVAFRAFEKPGGQRGFLWLMALAFVIVVVCAILFRLSYR